MTHITLLRGVENLVSWAGCPKPAGHFEPDDFTWALDTGPAATQAIDGTNPGTVNDAATALETWLHAPARKSAARDAGQRSSSLTVTPTLARDREVTARISCRTTGPGGRAHHPQTRHARRNRPDARYGDHDLALTWQWVHIAHAHLLLSPTWRGKNPTAKDRHHYRQFEDSLDERQRSNRASALDKRA